MKKIKLAILITLIAMASHAQTPEHYGASSGTLGTANSFFGYYSGNVANGSSANNSFFGSSSGRLTTSGSRNVAIGSSSLYSNTTGNENEAIGYQALYSNTTGSGNHAIGMQALYSNTTGYGNTAIGSYVLRNNSSGIYNIAIGEGALYSNTASYNVAIGGGHSMLILQALIIWVWVTARCIVTQRAIPILQVDLMPYILTLLPFSTLLMDIIRYVLILQV